jgi:hypothetical protein
MPSSTLLDDHLAWPRDQWERGAPWRLGHGLTVVGPGWHHLVRAAFAAVAEVPGAEVRDVRQKFAVLEIRVHHPDATQAVALGARITELTKASRSRCEGCGVAVPTLVRGAARWRLHCAECAALIDARDAGSERRLWERRARRPWPPTAGW